MNIGAFAGLRELVRTMLPTVSLIVILVLASCRLVWLEIRRRRVEGPLRSSEEKFRQIAENVREVIWMVNTTLDKVLYVNPAYEQIWGRSRESVYQHPMSWFEAIQAEDRDRVQDAFLKQARGESTECEYRIRTRDDQERWISARCFPVRDDAGQVMRIVGIAHDITERKQAEAAVKNAKEAAELANRLKNEFLANVNHEIRTPLNGILATTELLLHTQLTPEQQEDLWIVKSSAESLLHIVNDILDFAKIEGRKLRLEQIDFDVRDCIARTEKALAIMAEHKNLRLVCQIEPGVPRRVLGDPDVLRQVVINVVNNAIKFTEHGEVRLRVEASSEGPNEVVLHFIVSDTGIGIPAEKQEWIFQAFTQADGSLTRRIGGVGLGLAIVWQLVDMMQGRVWLESEVGKGSTFHFTARFGLTKDSLGTAK